MFENAYPWKDFTDASENVGQPNEHYSAYTEKFVNNIHEKHSRDRMLHAKRVSDLKGRKQKITSRQWWTMICEFFIFHTAPRVHCEVSRWSSWRPCSVTCGSGVQLRGRAITKKPMNDGIPCPNLIDSRPCIMKNCSGKFYVTYHTLFALLFAPFRHWIVFRGVVRKERWGGGGGLRPISCREQQTMAVRRKRKNTSVAFPLLVNPFSD